MNSELPGNCSGRSCGFTAFAGGLGCDDGPGSCWTARMLDAETSSFHDQTLQDATRKIREVLESIPEDKEGRKLSFVHTTHGTILAWVHHGVKAPERSITIDSDPEEVAKALGLKLERAE